MHKTKDIHQNCDNKNIVHVARSQRDKRKAIEH